MKRAIFHLLMTGTLLVGAQPALAQQTPENAQKFIELILKQGSVTTGVDVQAQRVMDSGWNCDGMSVCYWTRNSSGSVRWVSSGSCSTALSVYISETSWRGDKSNNSVLEPVVNVTLPWDAISAATVNGSEVRFAWKGRVTYLSFPTADVATRTQKAMQLLIDTCDPTKATGF